MSKVRVVHRGAVDRGGRGLVLEVYTGKRTPFPIPIPREFRKCKLSKKRISLRGLCRPELQEISHISIYKEVAPLVRSRSLNPIKYFILRENE